ncbi:PREDICTED: 28S ribosomal protein S18b, mitochondrial [Thamnophis sirtalis]|uniref:Small ribosomal subunit protein mS40 n=1 Tax=Thamnophis sirtalis TaxID=35019 RepID=A0A6I9YGH7_9SAUR|nr:PREDICTED: 28S ribosomal protein S18b, mitochondrial [Thamnophis sirtalis]
MRNGICAPYKMAASSRAMLLYGNLASLAARVAFNRSCGLRHIPTTSLLLPEQLAFRTYCTEVNQEEPTKPGGREIDSHYKEMPWKYLESEEYITKYGNDPVWLGYRRNFKGQVPPQKTRKMCIRRGHVCGNPCPICRDQHLVLDYRNVKLLEQFICPHSNIILDATQTGVCVKKQKELVKAIDQAQDNGLLPVSTPLISFPDVDWSNQHPAVSKTPPSPALCSKTSWYPWYDWQQPPEKKIKLFRRIYKDYLKEESKLS